MSRDPAAVRSATLRAVLGLVLVLAGIGGYFVVVFSIAAWLPSVRNDALPNWVLVVAGVGLSAAALRGDRGTRPPKILFGVNLALAAAFAAVLYIMPVVPKASGPALGASAPDFALSDQQGRVTRLADFHGSPLLLVFYRGHW